MINPIYLLKISHILPYPFIILQICVQFSGDSILKNNAIEKSNDPVFLPVFKTAYIAMHHMPKKAKKEREENPTVEDLLKDIRKLLQDK